MARLAESYRLEGFRDLSFIGKYAERFGLDPDFVISKSFDSVMNFIIMWKEQEEFRVRYEKLSSEMN